LWAGVLVSNVIPFKKPSLKKKAKEKTLCSSGFHKWEVVTNNQFDTKSGSASVVVKQKIKRTSIIF